MPAVPPNQPEALRDWHRLFGMLLLDYFSDTPFAVEVEVDVSQQQQFLDVVILRRRGRFTERLPDGLDDLVEYNLISFKSHHETVDAWAIKELFGHYVAYRKLVSASVANLLPEEQFHLYVVCARFPHNLANQIPWQERQTGVYHGRWGTDLVRIIVTSQLPLEAHNAPLHLVSGSADRSTFGRETYRLRSRRTGILLSELCASSRWEGLEMPLTLEDFDRWYAKKYFPHLTLEEQQEVLHNLPPEQQRDLFRSLPPEERLAGLTEEQIRAYLEKLTTRQSAPTKKNRRKR